MKLMLHIGTPKCGSTALQGWLSRNDEALRRDGVHYCAAYGRPRNWLLPLLFQESFSPNQFTIGEGIRDMDDLRARGEAAAAAFDAEIDGARRSGARWFVISNETLQTGLATPERVERLEAFLKARFDHISAILVLRPQIDLWLSQASQLARVGRPVGLAQFEQRQNPALYDYLSAYEMWARRFDVTPVAFSRQTGIVDAFAGLLGVDPAGHDTEATANTRLDYRVIGFLNNLAHSRVTNGELIEDRNFIQRRFPFETPLTVSAEQARAFQARYADDNRALCERAGLPPDALEPDWSRFGDEGNIETLDRVDWSPVMSAAILILQAEKWTEVARAAMLKAKLKSARNRGDKAEADLRRAEETIARAEKLARLAEDEPLGQRIAALATEIAAFRDRLANRRETPEDERPRRRKGR